MASRVLSLRVDEELWARIRDHAARRGISAQDYVVRTLIRDDFDERFKAAVEETERFYGGVPPVDAAAAGLTPGGAGDLGGAGALAPDTASPEGPAHSRPSAGIR